MVAEAAPLAAAAAAGAPPRLPPRQRGAGGCSLRAARRGAAAPDPRERWLVADEASSTDAAAPPAPTGAACGLAAAALLLARRRRHHARTRPCLAEEPALAHGVAPVLLVPIRARRRARLSTRSSGVWQPLWQEMLDISAPLLCFVNPKSGGGHGLEVLQSLERQLSPLNVCNLCDPLQEPSRILRLFTRRFSRGLRLVVAGGDGTVGSVIAMLQDMEQAGELPSWPSIAVLPLGTGNDLARVLGWGGGWAGEPLNRILAATRVASTTFVDLWNATIRPLSPGAACVPIPGHGNPQADRKLHSVAFCNYFGVGVDARIASRFDQMRRCFPRRFKNRTLNKVHYFWVGAIEFFASLRNSCTQLSKEVALRCDGMDYELGRHVKGIIFSNINSYGGGSKLTAQCCHQDGKLDVVLIRGPFGGVPHLALVKLGLARGHKLCQAKTVELTNRTAMPIQVDGEPWEQPPSRIEVTPSFTKASMLQRSDSEREGCIVERSDF